ncbi:hypothetical protein Tco_0741304, partial [Tanacetum coccineum]
IMSSATSAVTYTSVYTDSEPDRAFWGADDEEISRRHPSGRTTPASSIMYEEEREPIVHIGTVILTEYEPEPIYLELYTFGGCAKFPAEEQPYLL